MDLLFVDRSSDRAGHHSLRQLVYLARKYGVRIGSTGSAISLEQPAPAVDLSDEVRAYLSATPFPSGCFQALPGYHPALSEQFAEWLGSFRSRCDVQVRAALLDALELHRKRAEWLRVELIARECLSLDTNNEIATLALAEALARSGSTDRAVLTLRSYLAEVQTLSERLTPPDALVHERVSRSAVASGAPTSPLNGYEYRLCERESIRRLVHSINEVSGSALDDHVLDRAFDAQWLQLDSRLSFTGSMTPVIAETLPEEAELLLRLLAEVRTPRETVGALQVTMPPTRGAK